MHYKMGLLNEKLKRFEKVPMSVTYFNNITL